MLRQIDVTENAWPSSAALRRRSATGRAAAGELGSKAFARKVAYLPQQLPPAEGMTVRELVAIGRYPWHGALGRFGAADREKVEEAIALVGLKPLAHRLQPPAVNASGRGSPCWWRRTVAACCDEPTSALDVLIKSMFWRWCIVSASSAA